MPNSLRAFESITRRFGQPLVPTGVTAAEHGYFMDSSTIAPGTPGYRNYREGRPIGVWASASRKLANTALQTTVAILSEGAPPMNVEEGTDGRQAGIVAIDATMHRANGAIGHDFTATYMLVSRGGIHLLESEADLRFATEAQVAEVQGFLSALRLFEVVDGLKTEPKNYAYVHMDQIAEAQERALVTFVQNEFANQTG